MFGVQPEKPQRLAESVCRALVGRGPGPAILSTCVFKFQIAAVLKEEDSVIKIRVDDIARNLCVGRFSQGVHFFLRLVTSPAGPAADFEFHFAGSLRIPLKFRNRGHRCQVQSDRVRTADFV